MQSSTAIAIRALIMLIVLISVPLFAIFGKNLPDVVKGLVEGRLVISPASSGQATASNSVTQPFATNSVIQPTPYRATPDIAFAASGTQSNPMVTNPASSSLAKTGLPSNGPTPPEWRNPPDSVATQPASFQAPQEASPMMPEFATPHDSRTGAVANDSYSATTNADSLLQPRQTKPSTALPAANETTVMTGSAAVRPGGNSVTKSSTVNAGDERFRRVEMRLRQLGASQYELRTWGPDDTNYRFVCWIALSGGGANQVFQAIEDDPLRAMETVLADVEQSRSRPAR